MPNIASVLKAEISRLARKELRDGNDSLKKTVATQRSEIAALKRRLQTLESTVKRFAKGYGTVKAQSSPESEAPSESKNRFSAQSMSANRKRLDLSAADFGLLVGATGQSVYGWESGKAKPRAGAQAAIAALRGVGKKEVQARLGALRSK